MSIQKFNGFKQFGSFAFSSEIWPQPKIAPPLEFECYIQDPWILKIYVKYTQFITTTYSISLLMILKELKIRFYKMFFMVLASEGLGPGNLILMPHHTLKLLSKFGLN